MRLGQLFLVFSNDQAILVTQKNPHKQLYSGAIGNFKDKMDENYPNNNFLNYNVERCYIVGNVLSITIWED